MVVVVVIVVVVWQLNCKRAGSVGASVQQPVGSGNDLLGRIGRAHPARKLAQHARFVKTAAALQAAEDRRRVCMGVVIPVGLKHMPPLPPPVHISSQ